MKIIIKVNGYEKQEGKDYDSLTNQFEVVIEGDGQRFLNLVGQIISIVPEKPQEVKKTEVLNEG